MGTTQPIRNTTDVKKLTEYYKNTAPSVRNYALVLFALYTALRISDILQIRWKDVYDETRQHFREHLCLTEAKTGKEKSIALNEHLKDALTELYQQRQPKQSDFIFTKNTDYTKPLNRSQAYRIVKKAAEVELHEENISCHSLRKTFGYHAWKKGTPPALLMDIYNHSSYSITKRYLGIDQDERDSVYTDMDF